jgi:predicted nucleotidyltransferase
MERLYTTTAYTRRLNLAEAKGRLSECAKKVRALPNVKDVILFGSLTGLYTARSDADIMVIVKRDERRPMDRIPEYLAYFEIGMPVEVFVWTEEEIECAKREKNPFIFSVLSKGVRI